MYFFTPRGLKIRLDEEYCIAFSESNNISFKKMLILTEFFASLKDYFVFLCGLALFLSKADISEIFISTFLITLIGIITPLFYPSLKFYFKTTFGILFFEAIFHAIFSLYLNIIILIVVGLIFVGIKATLVFFLAFYLSTLLCWWPLVYKPGRRIYKNYKITITDVERLFINILRIHTSTKVSFKQWLENYKEYITVKGVIL